MPSHMMDQGPTKALFVGAALVFLVLLFFSKGFLFWMLPFALFWFFGGMTKARRYGAYGFGCGVTRDEDGGTEPRKRKNDDVIVVNKRKNDDPRYIETYDGQRLEVIREDDGDANRTDDITYV